MLAGAILSLAAGCATEPPRAWGPTRTENGWNPAASDGAGAGLAMRHKGYVWVRQAPATRQMAEVEQAH